MPTASAIHAILCLFMFPPAYQLDDPLASDEVSVDWLAEASDCPDAALSRLARSLASKSRLAWVAPAELSLREVVLPSITSEIVPVYV